MRNGHASWDEPLWQDMGTSPRPAPRRKAATRRKAPAPGQSALDRWLGDALIVAMLLIGFLFCVAAARAEAPLPDASAPISSARPA